MGGLRGGGPGDARNVREPDRLARRHRAVGVAQPGGLQDQRAQQVWERGPGRPDGDLCRDGTAEAAVAPVRAGGKRNGARSAASAIASSGAPAAVSRATSSASSSNPEVWVSRWRRVIRSRPSPVQAGRTAATGREKVSSPRSTSAVIVAAV